MSRLSPEDQRRQNRRVGLAVVLYSIGVVLLAGGDLLHEGFVTGIPLWLWLVPFVSGVVLAAVSIAILLAVRRELRHLPLH